MRTDSHNNPTAFTTDIAKEAGLVYGEDYTKGDPFHAGEYIYYTARLLKDPIVTTIKVIDKIGFYTSRGQIRWIYIGIPKWLWDTLDFTTKKRILGFMYQHEGGTEMKPLFS